MYGDYSIDDVYVGQTSRGAHVKVFTLIVGLGKRVFMIRCNGANTLSSLLNVVNFLSESSFEVFWACQMLSRCCYCWWSLQQDTSATSPLDASDMFELSSEEQSHSETSTAASRCSFRRFVVVQNLTSFLLLLY